MAEPPEEVVAMAERRAQARAAKDFAEADAIRERIASAGWTVEDTAAGYALSPAAPPELPGADRVDPATVPDVTDEPPSADVSLQWVCEGWPEDIGRAITSFRAWAQGRTVQFVVADVTGERADRWGDDVEVVRLRDGTGWASARNAGLRRARGRLVLALDGSIEATGDVVTPLAAALDDPAVGVCGPFGIVTTDLREFDDAPAAGPCEAVEGYLMAFRREI